MGASSIQGRGNSGRCNRRTPISRVGPDDAEALSKISLTAPQMPVIAGNEAILPALLACFAFGSQ
jgi:hypothetical protein